MKRLTLTLIAMLVCATTNLYAQQIIAHRGYHAAKGSYENTLSALKAAQEAGLEYVECDLNLTSDDEVVVVHGPWLGEKNDPDRLNIQRSDLATIRSKSLKNGEQVPTLEEYLDQAKLCPTTRLIIEIKDHATPQLEERIVRKVLDAVKERKMQDMVSYIAFREHVCNTLVKHAPSNTPISFLAGTFTPEYAHGMGYTGISYELGLLKRMPRWIKEAHKLGMTVNVWTVNCQEEAEWCIKQGVDFITTDKPDMVQKALGK